MSRRVAIFDLEEVRSWPCAGRCQPEVWDTFEWGCEGIHPERGDHCSLGAHHKGPHTVCDPDSHDPAFHNIYTWESDICDECDGDGEFATQVPYLTTTCPYCGGTGTKGGGR